MSFTSFTSATAYEPAVEETVDEGARHFDEGIRDVESILSLDLSNEEGVKKAADILKRNEKKLANFEKKALRAALRVDAFKRGVKAEAAKRKNGESELASELESNPGSVGKIPGAEEAAEAIRSSTRPAADILKRVADALQKAGDDGKRKNGSAGHHATVKIVDVEPRVSTTSTELFCGSYQAICDLLGRLGLYYLRAQIAVLQTGTRKANCVTAAYSTYINCAITRWWDLAYCNGRFSRNVSNCLLFA
jgi:hypothetical protein